LPLPRANPLGSCPARRSRASRCLDPGAVAPSGAATGSPSPRGAGRGSGRRRRISQPGRSGSVRGAVSGARKIGTVTATALSVAGASRGGWTTAAGAAVGAVAGGAGHGRGRGAGSRPIADRRRRHYAARATGGRALNRPGRTRAGAPSSAVTPALAGRRTCAPCSISLRCALNRHTATALVTRFTLARACALATTFSEQWPSMHSESRWQAAPMGLDESG